MLKLKLHYFGHVMRIIGKDPNGWERLRAGGEGYGNEVRLARCARPGAPRGWGRTLLLLNRRPCVSLLCGPR